MIRFVGCGLAVVSLRRDGHVGVVTLNRPSARNALNLDLMLQLESTVRKLTTESALRVALIVAHGDDFSVGGDLKELSRSLDELPCRLGELVRPFHRAILGLHELSVPVVVAVQGFVAGGALAFPCVADIVIAGRSATFVPAYGGVGLSADGGVSWFLPRLLGHRAATEFLVGGRSMTADEAEQRGLVTSVVADDRLHAEAYRVAEQIGERPPAAVQGVKRLLRSSAVSALSAHLDGEYVSMTALAATSESRAALVGRRPSPK